MTPPTQDAGPSKETKPRSPQRDSPTSGEQELDSLKRTLQETRRALTLTRAEAEKERELREALHAQLLDANAEIVASWDRRKEMARVIADQQAKLAEGRKETAALKRAQKKADEQISELEQKVAKGDQAAVSLKQVVANRDQAIAKRDKVLSDRQNVIANRDEKLAELKAQLRARYEELAVLERHIVQSTISGKAKRLARQVRDRTRKSFQGS